MSRVYVHRLIVTLPEGSDDPDWLPENWQAICDHYGWWSGTNEDGSAAVTRFHWPTRRNYLSADSASKRAGMLRRMGATVRVASRYVDFADLDPAPTETTTSDRRALDRMTRDGETYIGDGPYGA